MIWYSVLVPHHGDVYLPMIASDPQAQRCLGEGLEASFSVAAQIKAVNRQFIRGGKPFHFIAVWLPVYDGLPNECLRLRVVAVASCVVIHKRPAAVSRRRSVVPTVAVW